MDLRQSWQHCQHLTHYEFEFINVTIIWPRLVMSELLKSATMYQIDLVKVNEVFSHMVTAVTYYHHSHTWSYLSFMFKLVIHGHIGHTWSHWSHMVKLVTHGHIGDSGHTWSHWSHMVTLVTHGHIGHLWSQYLGPYALIWGLMKEKKEKEKEKDDLLTCWLRRR